MSDLSLYTLASDATNLLAVVTSDEANEEQRAQAMARLDEIGTALMAKVDRYAGFMAHLESQIALGDAEAKRLADRKRRFQNALDWMEGNALRVMDAHGWKELDGDTTTLAIRHNPPSVVVTNDEILPAEFVRITQKMDPDKVKIKAALKAGEEVPGAHLEIKRGIRRK
jgi:hypothetical protein